MYAGDVSDFHGVRLRRYVFSQEDFRNDSAMAADFYHDNLPTFVGVGAGVGSVPPDIQPHLTTAHPFPTTPPNTTTNTKNTAA